jgi:crotonobetainyl-CoA:carnitine CoA-transferase CaiB-like acyl-CoA transferase
MRLGRLLQGETLVNHLAHPPQGEKPLKFPDTPVREFQPPPQLGEHTEEVLRGLIGYDDEKLAALRAKGVIR